MSLKWASTALLLLQGWVLFAIPSSIDNSKSKYFPPIISQSGGSCAQASIIGYTFTYEMNRLLDKDASQAGNRFSYFYTWNFVNDGQDQGSLTEDGIRIAISNGVMNEEDFPPQPSWYEFRWETGYDKYLRAIHNRAEWLMYIDVTTEDGILEAKEYLSQGGVLGFSAYADDWKIVSYEGSSETGYKHLFTGLGTEGAHALTIAGYDDTVIYTDGKGKSHTGAFIAVNTWGEYFCSKGRFYLPYCFFTQEHDNSRLSHNLMGIKVKQEEPQIVFRIKLDYSSRDDLSIDLGFNDNWKDTIPKHVFTSPITDHRGGDHPMCGRLKGSVIDLGLDFSSNSAKLEGVDDPNYFIDIQRYQRGKSEGEGKFLGFWVYDYRNDKEHPKVYSCTEGIGKQLSKGHNYFSLMKYLWTSCSPVQWLVNNQPVAAPLVFKTADGKYAKVRFSDYDRENGTIKIKYVYSPSGDNNLK